MCKLVAPAVLCSSYCQGCVHSPLDLPLYWAQTRSSGDSPQVRMAARCQPVTSVLAVCSRPHWVDTVVHSHYAQKQLLSQRTLKRGQSLREVSCTQVGTTSPLSSWSNQACRLLLRSLPRGSQASSTPLLKIPRQMETQIQESSLWGTQ